MFVFCYYGTRLNRRYTNAWMPDSQPGHMMCFCKQRCGFIDIASLPAKCAVRWNIAPQYISRVRAFDVRNCGQRVDIYLDCLRCIRGAMYISGDYRSDCFTNMHHFCPSQNRPLRLEYRRFCVAHGCAALHRLECGYVSVGSSQDSGDTGHLECRLGVYALDNAVRDR